MSGDVGRCGNSAPTFIDAPPELCILLAGHAGWHRSDLGAEWNDVRGHPVSGDVRRQIAEALPESLGPVGLRRPAIPSLGVEGSVTGYGEVLLDALLPVVDHIARQRAAEELRAFAESIPHRNLAWMGDVQDALLARADALTAEPQP